MQHCTPETLALAALREPLPTDDAAHLDGCAACRAEVTSLQRSVDALAVPEFAASVAPVAPPPAVWGAIAAATGAGTAASGRGAGVAGAASTPSTASVPTRNSGRGALDTPVAAAIDAQTLGGGATGPRGAANAGTLSRSTLRRRPATSARHSAQPSTWAASGAGSGSRRAASASCSGVQCCTVHLQPRA